MEVLGRATILHGATAIVVLATNITAVVAVVVKDNSRLQRTGKATMIIGLGNGIRVVEVQEGKVVGVDIHFFGEVALLAVCLLICV